MSDAELVSTDAKLSLFSHGSVAMVGESGPPIYDRDVVVVTLEHGTDPDAVPIPDEVEGEPVVVEYGEQPEPAVDMDKIRDRTRLTTQHKERLRPVPPGVSTTSEAFGTGATGPLMRDGDTYLLTSNHHVWVDDRGEVGDNVYQPSEKEENVVGTLMGGSVDDVDFAWAEATEAATAEVHNVGRQAGSHSPTVGEEVTKSGPNTGVQTGTVEQTDVIATPAGASLTGQVLISVDAGGGDSGSPVLGDGMDVVGILHSESGDGHSIMSDITDCEAIAGAEVATTDYEPTNQSPNAVINVENADGTDLNVTFDAYDSSDPDGEIAEYRWDFGNGDASTTPLVSYTYDSAGTYDVTLTVTDDDGATDTASTTVTLEGGDGGDNGGGDQCSDTFNGIPKTEYGYEGTAQDLFQQWQSCDITTEQFQSQTGSGDGTDALVPPSEQSAGGGGLIVLAAVVAGGYWYTQRR